MIIHLHPHPRNANFLEVVFEDPEPVFHQVSFPYFYQLELRSFRQACTLHLSLIHI